MAAAQECGIALELGVETSPEAEAGTRLDVRSPEELLIALDRAYARLAPYESFAGFAVHDYGSLAALMEAGNGD